MIVRKDQLDNPHGTERRTDRHGTLEVLRYSQVGGLGQFGAYVSTLQPGARSSDRHWHEGEDEFLYVISGEATVVDDEGTHVLRPGDAACWPAGAANAHHVFNRSKAPCSYLIVGTRAAHDVVHYPDSGEILYNDEDDERRVIRWRLVRTDGTVLKTGTYSYACGSTLDGAWQCDGAGLPGAAR